MNINVTNITIISHISKINLTNTPELNPKNATAIALKKTAA